MNNNPTAGITRPFLREERYYVLKISDMRKYLSREKFEYVGAIAEKLNAGRAVDGKTVLQAVVVEHDWPEYERVWQMIETRVVTTRRNFLNCNNDRRFWPIPDLKPWITLTDEDVQEIGNEVHRSMPNDADELMELLAIYHEIESRLREKNMPAQQLEQALWGDHLKEGETPFERFMRERKDGDALLRLYQRAVAENEQLKTQQQKPCGEAYLCDSCKTPFDGAFQCPSCGHGCATKEPVYTTPPQHKQGHLTWPIKGVRVDGDKVIIMAKGGNDAARWLCGEILFMAKDINAQP
jgi:rubrerythrin